MKNKKRAFLYVVLIIVLIMSMASTASANVQYSGYFSRFVNTSGDVLLVTYVRNNNTRCYFSAGANEYTTSFSSSAWELKPGTTDKWVQFDGMRLIRSGGSYTHRGNLWRNTRGRLRLHNTQAPGYVCAAYGVMS